MRIVGDLSCHLVIEQSQANSRFIKARIALSLVECAFITYPLQLKLSIFSLHWLTSVSFVAD